MTMKTMSVMGMIAGVATVMATTVGATVEEGCTPAQSAMIASDAQTAAAILATLVPIACGVVDAVDPANAAAICEVITDVSTGATAIVPIFNDLAVIEAVVAAKPADAAVTAAIATVKAHWKPRVRR